MERHLLCDMGHPGSHGVGDLYEWRTERVPHAANPVRTISAMCSLPSCQAVLTCSPVSESEPLIAIGTAFSPQEEGRAAVALRRTLPETQDPVLPAALPTPWDRAAVPGPHC